MESAPEEEVCPKTQKYTGLLPATSDDHLSVDYWLNNLNEKVDLDAALLTDAQIDTLSQSMVAPRPGYIKRRNLLDPMVPEVVADKILDRVNWYEKKLGKDFADSQKFRDDLQKPATPYNRAQWHIALDRIPMTCAPSSVTVVDQDTLDPRIDRNACGAVFSQEPFRIVAESGPFKLAQTELSWGWISDGSGKSVVVEKNEILPFIDGNFVSLSEDTIIEGMPLRKQSRLPFSEGSVLFASPKGVAKSKLEAASMAPRKFSRRNILEAAFSYLDAEYGFGGKNSGIDCSRFVEQVFAPFGVELPRHSSWQSKATSYYLDVEGMPVEEKKRVLEQANKSGMLLLEMRGHIMLYLGQDDEGIPMAIHSMGHFLTLCDEEVGETKQLVDRVVVSDLSLGADTSKTSLLERIKRVAVIGDFPDGDALHGLAIYRPAAPMQRPTNAQCKEAGKGGLFTAPLKPHEKGALRVLTTRIKKPGAASLHFFPPQEGEDVALDIAYTRGPPWGVIGTVNQPSHGLWTVALGDGQQLLGCRQIKVRSSFRASKGMHGDTAWRLRSKWSQQKEDLYAMFIERLFDYPQDQTITWKNLHTLLRDPSRNILHNYLGLREEENTKMVPDCADLPYALRAYFAWKLGLPFAMHRCTRGTDGRPPKCKPDVDNLFPRTALVTNDKEALKLHQAMRDGEDVPDLQELEDASMEPVEVEQRSRVEGFAALFRKTQRSSHSSSGRTMPKDELGDFYPVPLSKNTIRPGMMFIDPYGHLIMVGRWLPQTKEGSGSLIGIDAQPDGTIGRRKFWRGSFLFHPGTHAGGAGFKAFRPVFYNKDTEKIEFLENKKLRRKTYRYSLEQYEGDESAFYDKMQQLINPRPLDAETQLADLVSALKQQVVRRVTSVNNGEDYLAKNSDAPMEMPEGKRIFLTTGPWEDFATPSRDWRLLVAIHTVLDFPSAVGRNPTQYGVSVANGAQEKNRLVDVMNEMLSKEKFEYTRSDGSMWELSLRDVVFRKVELEMAYNPNDCPEIRWGATSENEKEFTTCQRHAPKEQIEKMKQYRHWFSERRRPAT